MRSLVRYPLLLLLVSTCFAIAYAQGGGAASKQPQQQLSPTAPESNANNWKQFSSEGGRFTILFPGTPDEGVQMVDTAVGNLAMHIAAMRSAAEYAATYTDFPQNMEATGSARRF